ncbi:hypothetical protein GUITHDRAFT_101148 [Guillardia theta CCMP2712]|uniref:Uncharacterized protein n=1 Tax=Guillardia theta (strain CCMP2712) TaxID=905079 RepID=L1JYK2_GUITC|nr:hypothetical protein GUITHDRAFT_101148 [Guillardia theta CCMP2712]EKX53447.1 hypothetical protein GUITHDRAFT_101148 [Guillardia theta CCMP2712]|eukprot:XP_005840427.1 hypothetical protein GUITHDRAFT_101148 [Guillardia theta CCMP2712]
MALVPAGCEQAASSAHASSCPDSVAAPAHPPARLPEGSPASPSISPAGGVEEHSSYFHVLQATGRTMGRSIDAMGNFILYAPTRHGQADQTGSSLISTGEIRKQR